ncbi:hypothetical protein MMC34_005622 [Xylographa carneopallida]|nr:hypothetical protein [Xylographa carneopallida]
MQRHLYALAALALVSTAPVLGQDTTGNPLNVFISLAGGAVTAVETAVATQATPSLSSTSPASAPASTMSAVTAATSTAAAAAATSSGLSHQTLLDIVIPVVVIGVLLLALLALCIYCCLRRRRRRSRTATPVPDDEVTTWRRPENPGRSYNPSTEASQIPMSQQPTVPLMAATTTTIPERPYTAEHPAFRNPNAANPFVPLPPSPRRTAPNARAGLTDGTVAGAPAFVEGSHTSRLRKSRSGLHDGYAAPYGNTTRVYADPSTDPDVGPVGAGAGLNDPYDRFGAPPQGNYYNRYGELVVPALEHGDHPTYAGPSQSQSQSQHQSQSRKPLLPGLDTTSGTSAAGGQEKRDRPPTPFGLSGLGGTSSPPLATNTSTSSSNQNQPQSPYARIGAPYTAQHVQQLQTDQPSLSLLHTNTNAPIPYPTPSQSRSIATRSRGPAPGTPPLVPSRSPNRRSAFRDSTYDSFGSERHAGSVESGSGGSGSGSAESWQTGRMERMDRPWEERERRYSAGSGAGARRASGSPGVGVGGKNGGGSPGVGGKRLRFSDVDAEEGQGRRWSQGVGEAL